MNATIDETTQATITIPADHPAVFYELGAFSYQGDCPAATAGTPHQTYITVGHSDCPACGAAFDTYLHRELGKPIALVVRW